MKWNLIALTVAGSIIAVMSSGAAFGATSAAKTEYDAAKKTAAVRYADDRKLCADEHSSRLRMQCLRDAKAEYGATLKTASENYQKASAVKSESNKPLTKTAPVCKECGKVVAVRVAEQKGESTPLGMIAGGVAGAVLGHQVGGGTGKDIATIAGAAGGAYAGHKIEEHMKTTQSWVVSVHFDDGSDRDYSFAADPGYAAGDPVKMSGDSIVRR